MSRGQSSASLPLRRPPVKCDEPIVRTRLPARDLGAYPGLDLVVGLIHILKQVIGSAPGGAKPLHAAGPALQGRFHGSAPLYEQVD
jgi:hypothetical protein